jgi:phosphoribosylaminoimidazole carboxylase PurE protein
MKKTKPAGKLPGKATGKAPGKAKVAIIMGSDSDFPVMKDAVQVLNEFGIPCEVKIVSAHRTPVEMGTFAKSAARRGIQVIIAGAGGAAHLPGMVAAYCELPVIGVPVPMGTLQGQDALLSIVQMPKGVPVATVAIGNAYNAGLLAIQILASGGSKVDLKLRGKIVDYKSAMRKKVLGKKL